MWALETVTVDDGSTFLAGVAEDVPAQNEMTGWTTQRVTLMSQDAVVLDPPTRVEVRGQGMRVLGTQLSPFTTWSLINCERVNLDLPDTVEIGAAVARVMDPVTGLFPDGFTVAWSGSAHIVSGVPETVDMAGEDAPRDRVTITLPLDAPYATGLEVRVTESRTPGLTGAVFTLSGEVLDSTADARRVIGYRPGV